MDDVLDESVSVVPVPKKYDIEDGEIYTEDDYHSLVEQENW